MIYVIDHKDSFTHNVVHQLSLFDEVKCDNYNNVDKTKLNKSKVIVFDKKAGLDGYKSLWRQLKGREFDALLHMQYAIRASIATLGIKAKYKLGFSSDRSQDFQTLFTNVQVPSPQSLHVADGLMAFAHQIGVPKAELDWVLSYSNHDQAWAESLQRVLGEEALDLDRLAAERQQNLGEALPTMDFQDFFFFRSRFFAQFLD